MLKGGKLWIALLGIVLLVFLVSCSSNYVEIDNGIEVVKVKVEIADDDKERAKGLMFIEDLGEYEGMFFIYENVGKRSFWMKSTLIPLDIIFISEKNEILNILEAEPCVEDPCRTYDSFGDVKYVLEVNKGFSKENNIKAGDSAALR